MTILGIDTATAVAAAGFVRAGEVIAEVAEVSRKGHAELLPELVRRACLEAGASIAEVGALAVSVGPGSFTGLRIGLSFAKGIAYSAGLPLVGVETLEALAWLAPPEFRQIAVATDARKGEVYLAVFLRSSGRVERVSADEASTPVAAVSRIRELFTEDPGVVIGDAAEAYADAFAPLLGQSIELAPFAETHPRGSMVALLGEQRLSRGAETRADRVEPRYVRASAAEINLQRAASPVEPRWQRH